MNRICLIAVAAASLALLVPAQAEAWARVGSATEVAESDGARWVAWLSSQTQLTVVDTSASERSQIDLAGRCENPYGLVVGPAVALIRCAPATATDTVAVIALRTGQISTLPPVAPGLLQERAFLAVGRQWAEFDQNFEKAFSRAYVNLVSGEERSVAGAHRVPDLDAAELDRPLCTPVARPADPETADDESVAGPEYGVVRQTGQWTVYRAPTSRSKISIKAWRCGSHRPVSVARCRDLGSICPDPNVGAGIVTWSSDRNAGVARLGSASGIRKTTVSGPRVRGRRPRFATRHTRTRLFASVIAGDEVSVWMRRVPRLKRSP